MDKRLHLFLSIVFTVVLAGPAMALSFIKTNSFVSGENDVLTNELGILAVSIQIKGQAQNDLFLLATSGSWGSQSNTDGNILLDGKFENDIWALGDTISLGGAVSDHARLLARSVTISGAVSNGLTTAGNSIHITDSALLNNDVMLFGENIIIEGNIHGNLATFAKSVTINGTISGNVNLTAGDIVVLPRTRIGGDLVYSSPAELVLDKGVTLHGQLIREEEVVSKAERTPIISPPSLLIQSWFFTGALLAGALLLLLFPVYLNESASQIKISFWKCLLTGFIAACLVPLLCVFLTISCVGLPLALLIASAFLILAYAGKFAVAMALGAIIIRQNSHGIRVLPRMAVGLVILYLVAGMGLAGMVIAFLIACLGTGAMINTGMARRTSSA